jgi:hypothetical protein
VLDSVGELQILLLADREVDLIGSTCETVMTVVGEIRSPICAWVIPATRRSVR